MTHWDVAIAGGGPAGATAALVLAQAGLKVLLAHGTPGTALGEGLPPNTRPLLTELGVWERVRAGPHRVSHGTLSVWGSAELRGDDYLRRLHGPGLQLDRAAFDTALRDAARDAGAHLVPLHLDVEPAAHGPWRLVLGTAPVQSRYLVDATGRAARLGRRLGATRQRDDTLTAFAMRLGSDTGTDRSGSTYVEAVEDGWWYSVLLPDTERLAVFLSDVDLIECRALDTLWEKLRKTKSLRALCEDHGYRPRRFLGAAPAHGARLTPCVGPDWLAVGDAALAFDPLSSKGIAHAIYTGKRGAEALLATHHGAPDALAAYAAHLHDVDRVYRQGLAHHYAAEGRWPTAPFWARRQRPEHPTLSRSDTPTSAAP